MKIGNRHKANIGSVCRPCAERVNESAREAGHAAREVNAFEGFGHPFSGPGKPARERLQRVETIGIYHRVVRTCRNGTQVSDPKG